VIRSFACEETRRLFELETIRKLPFEIQRRALRKLQMLDAAVSLDSLRTPPANRLEKLLGDRGGQYSIRINNQWRICFRFENSEAWDVEIADYH